MPLSTSSSSICDSSPPHTPGRLSPSIATQGDPVQIASPTTGMRQPRLPCSPLSGHRSITKAPSIMPESADRPASRGECRTPVSDHSSEVSSTGSTQSGWICTSQLRSVPLQDDPLEVSSRSLRGYVASVRDVGGTVRIHCHPMLSTS